MKTILFKNFKKTPVRICCPTTGRSIRLAPFEEREFGETYEDMLLQAGVVPMDDIQRQNEGTANEAAAKAEAEAAEAAAEAEANAKRAEALRTAQEKAETEANVAKRSAAKKTAAKKTA